MQNLYSVEYKTNLTWAVMKDRGDGTKETIKWFHGSGNNVDYKSVEAEARKMAEGLNAQLFA